MSKSKIKWLVSASQNLAVASIITTHDHMYDGAIALNMTRINCLEFADLLDKLIDTHDSADTYSREATFTMDRITIHKSPGGTCSIIYNNCRIEYHGYIPRLVGLSDAIRKSYTKYESKIVI